jgi:hypothetical protein
LTPRAEARERGDGALIEGDVRGDGPRALLGRRGDRPARAGDGKAATSGRFGTSSPFSIFAIISLSSSWIFATNSSLEESVCLLLLIFAIISRT